MPTHHRQRSESILLEFNVAISLETQHSSFIAPPTSDQEQVDLFSDLEDAFDDENDLQSVFEEPNARNMSIAMSSEPVVNNLHMTLHVRYELQRALIDYQKSDVQAEAQQDVELMDFETISDKAMDVESVEDEAMNE